MQRCVFCDFDGTITAEESLEAVFKRFAPDMFSPIKDKMMALEISIREGVRQTLESIPSASYLDILEYVKNIPIRPGFESLLDFLDDQGVPFVIVSGGLRGMIDARLGSLVNRMHKIFAADVDISGEFMHVTSDFEGDMELVAKVDVLNLFNAKQKIVIGDGATDINMAQEGSLVFARDSLAFFLDHMKIPYRQWSDFFDVQTALSKIWQNA
ncbi:MAG: HAD-IB family phosphatase [Desulfobacteraceae bacterium]|nr:HAD-IB family phosphatase [Desulfobacteraceae bacterium]MBC2757609.1 HAD-IB family phosphatase [Desulfobacteraceae bacterium]